ncbi:3-oxoacyl-[acyl-carrier-protein]- synthase [Scheffersomyces stipitis CBS 6054]|uniref:3-oxoacyl-[acyl-carrier-protein] synthase n=1 Tax=Scheffersomyces stipitis (strain ATCC 58785 / CBS 6054 / NBRC 10063 / NRRL Y-11545) TaxID=322104 RepID=A3LZS7_PICST|nr:3-oxoacyl-[acyl-carrier-protein]- synthase [Scheffersomyces stipitis CBS 6054]ABN68392.2 3-oxoacyl-[acyl-carrier-protein]- synthase [Scheffersomyces stipitis CBS 6054]
MANRVVVTGLGAITPLGVGVTPTWRNLLAGKSGLISTTTLPDYESGGWAQIPSKVIGKVPEGSINDYKWQSQDHFDKSEARRLALFTQYGMVASKEALEDAKLHNLEGIDKRRFGVAVGSGIGSFHDVYENSTQFSQSGYKRVQPLFIPKLLTNMAAGNISIKYGLQGPLHAVSTACATGLHAIGDAYNFIKNDYADVMICGGTESSIHPLALAGFARARSVVTDFNDDPQAASRPFDGSRNGFVLSEGCGIVILERLDHALNRGVKPDEIYAEIKGYGLSGDAHHITAPMETGEGAYLSMKMAVDRSAISPEQVGYVNAHATSTVIGDRAENNAILRLFGDKATGVAVSSTKSSIGHLLGAAGAVESIFTIKAVKDSEIPPTLNLDTAGGHKDDKADNFSHFDYVAKVSKKKELDYALCNSFGFGGVNSTLCFGKFRT